MRRGPGELLERREVLAALTRVTRQAQAGRGQVLFVRGEAGLGKTEILRRARSEGRWALVRESVGSPMESGLAFSYLSQALEARGFADLLKEAPGSSRAGLQVRWFMAVQDWLVQQAAAGPVLLALDDLHWADEESLALLSFLGRRLAQAAVAIVATLRPWPDGAAALADDLVGAGIAELHSLAPLSDDAARELYLRQAPPGGDPAQAGVVVRLASGNPLLVDEAARAAGPLAELGAQATPQVVGAMRQALLLSSFGSLAGEARSCAQAGAVLGSPFRLGLVEEVTGLGYDGSDAGVSTLFAAGLWHSAGTGRAAFRHDLVAEAIYGDMDEGRRRRLHERAWQVLAQRGEAALATAHALAADLVGVPAAAETACRAGREALGTGAASSAVRLLEAAGTLSGPAVDPAVVADLAGALLYSGRPAEALTTCERCLALAGSETIRLRALGLLGRAAMLCGDRPRAAAATKAALELAAAVDPEAFVSFAADEVDRMSGFDGMDQALARLEEVQQRAAALGAGSAGRLEVLRAYLTVQAGPSRDLKPLDEAARAVIETPSAADASAPWNPVACFVLTSGWLEDFESADRCYRSWAARADAKEQFITDTVIAFAYNETLIRQGRLAEAAALVAGAAHASEVISFGVDIGLHSRAAFALEADRIDEAATLLTAFQAVADAAGQWQLSCWGAHTRGRLLLTQGKAGEAADVYRSLANMVAGAGLRHPCVVPWAGAALAAFHRSGASGEMAAVVEWLEQNSTGSPCRWPRAMAALGRGLLAEDADDHASADEAFGESLRLLRAVRLPLDLAQVALAYSAVLRRRGERKKARAVAAEAAGLAASCGSALLTRQVRDEQARLGARRSRGDAEGLTEAEARVAVLAAHGASNAEIAAALVVSVRTVEAHLGRVYAKLGLPSRRQLMIRYANGSGLTTGATENSRADGRHP